MNVQRLLRPFLLQSTADDCINGVAVQRALWAKGFWPKFRPRSRAAKPRPLHAELATLPLFESSYPLSDFRHNIP